MTSLIDTHQHLMYPQKFGYSWANDIPVLNEKTYDVDTYAGLVGEQVEATIFMETGVDEAFYRDETQFALELAADSSNNMAGIIAAAFPENAKDFDDWLEQTAQNPLISGYRRILHVVDNAVSQDQTFRQNVRKIGAHGKTFDMCFLESQLPLAIELAKACDNTQLILNHCGVPNVAGGDMQQWKHHIAELAKLEHVACKISGVVAYCNPDQDRETAVRPYIEYAIEQFGATRCVWGSDWPVVNMADGLPDWLAITHSIFQEESAENKQLIFADNARRIYQLAN
ncbi:putative TIM-barrel fold metal-dependent hydrolase [Maritalea mobilis]|uniref:Putative TIM-barrel fold metal-dependent hydrolase n=1 Tax=Maritalea mobilis TaxID=483324 RepID=A0A4R6VLN2_9HYPH|nr:amidohydrolase family protein [Maritalea mobilis]TDQ64415.1 putative TIM-barrel fold metal-dependent hydrolase [Maritalea mobilis]